MRWSRVRWLDRHARECVWKHRHETPEDAAMAAVALGRQSDRNLYAYACPYCFGFHLTRTQQESAA